MRRFFFLMCLPLLLVHQVKAEMPGNFCGACPCAGWHGIVGAGYAWSLKAGVDNPDPSFWDFANEGYDQDLGESPFFFIGFGKQFCYCLSLDLTYAFYETFHYQKYQTGASATPGFTGAARTRFFDLDHQNVLFTASWNPRFFDCLSCGWLDISPLVGVGIGVGVNRVTNFHTVGFASPGVGSTTSIGRRHETRASFAWQVLAGLCFNFCCPFSVDIEYRYYDGGHFRGPNQTISNTAAFAGTALSGAPWKGKLKANEVVIDLLWQF